MQFVNGEPHRNDVSGNHGLHWRRDEETSIEKAGEIADTPQRQASANAETGPNAHSAD
jgi:hypothetical protein